MWQEAFMCECPVIAVTFHGPVTQRTTSEAHLATEAHLAVQRPKDAIHKVSGRLRTFVLAKHRLAEYSECPQRLRTVVFAQNGLSEYARRGNVRALRIASLPAPFHRRWPTFVCRMACVFHGLVELGQ